MKRKSPYPKLGTVVGDQVIGACEAIGCGQILRRGDRFITLLGDRLICGKCSSDGFKIKEAAMQ